mmetsp:Transcript_4880/g.5860  ORF Transcript_4880/g.5860 Transcript_4880/m.5860 type:complete len:128 (+) Transcript_4880:95-478(+)|eukprot:CAMPEP_0195256546 /NCGR_PEP_ID=MMETSP0706-20130129/6297_1 /TAXON_ID=33640 /ORGANISM="Asterionellopsis glacialis, Strain CCMP134" /LENGTH=127 /DNA_ID=CAMNT_0040309603 /DNA_START=102 /DNA_END=485 /DNA_ORIENTATION=-
MKTFVAFFAVLASLALVSGFTVAPKTLGGQHCCISRSTGHFMSEESNVEEMVNDEPPKPAVKCPDCDLCDGSGRILGGIGVILPWWPIKAYRPCPNFINAGGRYVRTGQPLDEIAFGRDSTYDGGSN